MGKKGKDRKKADNMKVGRSTFGADADGRMPGGFQLQVLTLNEMLSLDYYLMVSSTSMGAFYSGRAPNQMIGMSLSSQRADWSRHYQKTKISASASSCFVVEVPVIVAKGHTLP